MMGLHVVSYEAWLRSHVRQYPEKQCTVSAHYGKQRLVMLCGLSRVEHPFRYWRPHVAIYPFSHHTDARKDKQVYGETPSLPLPSTGSISTESLKYMETNTIRQKLIEAYRGAPTEYIAGLGRVQKGGIAFKVCEHCH